VSSPCLRAAAAASVLVVAACASQNQTVGTVGGGVLGAIIGKALGGDRGAVIGGALGAAIGYQIGKRMDAQDRQRLAEARLKALEESREQKFHAASVKTDVVVTPTPSFYEPSARTLALASDLQRFDLVEAVPQTVVGMSFITLFKRASFDGEPKLVIPKGATLTRIADVRSDARWVLVGDRNFGLGYAPAHLLDKEIVARIAGANAAGGPAAAVAETASTRRAPAPTPAAPPARNRTDGLMAADRTYMPPESHLQRQAVTPAAYDRMLDAGNRASATGSASVQYVKPSVECKELTSILLSDERESEKTKACRRAGGAWS
jgi:hypothetical protein